jgi:polysaccharide pyruvyl transferase WcaK-like protein
MMKKILFLGATPFIGNRGVSALTFGSLNLIFRFFPNSKVNILEYSKEPVSFKYSYDNKENEIKFICIRFSKKIFLKNHIAILIIFAIMKILIPFKFFSKMVFSLFPVLKEIDSGNIAFSISGGDSFSDIYGFRRFIYATLPQILIIFMKIPLIHLPQTYGPYNSKTSSVISKWILKNSTLIYARDLVSINYIKNKFKDNKISNKLHFNFDVGFLLEPIRPKNFKQYKIADYEKSKIIIGLNISGLLYVGGYTQNDQFQMGINYPLFIEDLIDWLIVKKNTIVFLIPHVFGNQLESDSKACSEMYDKLKYKYENKLVYIDEEFDSQEIKYIIGKFDLFIGSRMHSCIAALSQNIPAIGISYSRKFTGVYQTLNLHKLVIHPGKNSIKEVYKLIEDTMENRKNIEIQLMHEMLRVKNRLNNIFDLIKINEKN